MDLIRLIYTDADVDSIAEEAGIPTNVARERADSWANAISDTAATLIAEQLHSVITTNQP